MIRSRYFFKLFLLGARFVKFLAGNVRSLAIPQSSQSLFRLRELGETFKIFWKNARASQSVDAQTKDVAAILTLTVSFCVNFDKNASVFDTILVHLTPI